MAARGFRFGPWQVRPDSNFLLSETLSRQLEPRAMDVLVFLCTHPQTVISADTLLDVCWGSAAPGDNAVHKIITQLRRALGDSSSAPRFIETIRKRGYRLLAEVSHDDEVVAGSWAGGAPFRGLEAFAEEHAAIFFGRKFSLDQLLQTVQIQAQGGCAMALVLGPSGAGKTSLVQAGLVPALKASAARGDAGLAIACHVKCDCADVGPGDLLETLASVLLDSEIDDELVFAHDSAVSLARRLRDELPGVLAQIQQGLGRIRLMLFVDRLEAVFRSPGIDQAARQQFIAVLDRLACSGCVLVVLACRNDFYHHLANYPALVALKKRAGHFDLAPPGSAEIAQIIRQPAQAAGLQFALDEASGQRLDDLLCETARIGPDSLPLLEYCLHELYRRRGPSGELSHAVLRDLGGIEGAIGARAEEVISALGPLQVAALPKVLSLLLLVSEDEITVTSRRTPWSALQTDSEKQLVKTLVDARLFVSDLHAGTAVFGIAHEALLRRWPRVLDWIGQHRDALQVRTRIGAQARRWQASGCAGDMLLPPGTQANQARALLEVGQFSFSDQEQAFIGLSLRRIRRGDMVRMAVAGVVIALGLLASGLGIAARSAQLDAEQHRTDAEGLMGFMLGEFVEKLRPLGRLDLLDSVSNRALSYLSAASAGNATATALSQRAKALQLISEVKIARADPAGAAAALGIARRILDQQLQANPANAAFLKSAGENAFWLGQIHFDQKDLDHAEQYFREYRDLSDRLAAATPGSVDGWIEQSYAHNSLGSLALQRGDVARAASEFALSVKLKSAAYARVPHNTSLAADLADSLSWLASAQQQLGQLKLAADLYGRQLALLRMLHEAAPRDALWTSRLAYAWSLQAELKQASGDLGGAREDLYSAESMLRLIVQQDPSNRSWQRNLYVVRLRIHELEPSARRTQQALDTLAAQAAELSRLEPKKLDLQVMLESIVTRKAALLLERGEAGRAEGMLASALGRLERVRAEAPADVALRDALAESLLLRADVALRTGASALAERSCRDAQELLRPAAHGSTDFRVLAPWVRAHACLNESGKVSKEQLLLEHMHYRDPFYLQYLSTHQKKES